MKKSQPRRQFNADMKQKAIQEVFELQAAGFTIQAACRKAGISRSQYYRWCLDYRRVLKGEKAALEPKSRRPKRLARKTPEHLCRSVIELATSGQFLSAHAIAQELLGCGSKITTKTVIAILERENLYGWITRRDEAGKLLMKKRGLLNIQK